MIVYFEFGVQIDLETFSKEMVKKFGKKNYTISDKRIWLGDIELIDKSINVNLLGAKLTFDVYQLSTNDEKTHLIAFQDSKNEDGSDSSDGLEAMEIINKTIEIK